MQVDSRLLQLTTLPVVGRAADYRQVIVLRCPLQDLPNRTVIGH